MVAGDTEADLAVNLETPGWGQEAERGWPEWVCGWEGYAAMIEATCVGSWRGGTGEGEVPVVEVGVADRSGSEVRAWVFVEVC
jgi:hypothetical protein